jgi:hypothetical protein
MTNETIQVTVSERGDNRAVYDARIGDRLICTSRQPLLAAARVLVGEGVDPSAVLEMKRPGSSHVALRAPVGVAARLTVDESRPRFVPWKPFAWGTERDGKPQPSPNGRGRYPTSQGEQDAA